MTKKMMLSKMTTQPNQASSCEIGLDDGDPPTLRDLTERLRLTPNDGKIWFDDRRMVLLGANAFGVLRREIIESLGFSRACSLLMRVGFSAGSADAAFVRKHWPLNDEAGALTAGERLHAVMGMVKVETVRRDHDIPNGIFNAEFLWHGSIEAAEHINAYGLSREPVCWMQLGYASGYASAFYGKRVIYRELECAGCGGSFCRIVGEMTNQEIGSTHDLSWLTPGEYLAPEARKSSRQTTGVTTASSPASIHEKIDTQKIVGISAAVSIALQKIERVAPTPATVLFNGESGVGKDLFANELHRKSNLANGPFIALNCAAIPDTLVEAELFGVEKGAFTGAEKSRPGRFERANGGTLFLDEIPSLSYEAQGKLLRTLQNGEIERVGGAHPIQVNVRVVAASNKDLFKEVQNGLFREDLYYRLNVFPIRLPPLRERQDDIPLLIEHFLYRYSNVYKKNIPGLTRKASEALLDYSYPGNIRELQNLIERGVINALDSEPLNVFHMFDDVGFATKLNPPGQSGLNIDPTGELEAGTSGPDLLGRGKLDDTQKSAKCHRRSEAEILSNALYKTDGNVSKAARELGVTRAKLAYRIQKAGLDPSLFRHL